MANIKSIDWYNKTYGEEWGSIVQDEDRRLGRNSDGTYGDKDGLGKLDSRDAHWAAHPINLQ